MLIKSFLILVLLSCLVSCRTTCPSTPGPSPVIGEDRAREIAIVTAKQMGIGIDAYAIDVRYRRGSWFFSFQEKSAERRGWPAQFSIRVQSEDNVEVFRGR
jgi:hypothetical protein